MADGYVSYKEAVIKVASEHILSLEDGYRYFWPSEACGAWSAKDLRIVADHLDALNKDWEEKITALHTNP